jgi:putative Holliday junction resolvase
VYYTNDVQAIILGYPTDVNGKKNSQTLLVEQFYNLLVQNISCKVIYHDERYSTKQATYDLKFNLGLKSSQIKKIKDKMSAVVILEDYLSSLK